MPEPSEKKLTKDDVLAAVLAKELRTEQPRLRTTERIKNLKSDTRVLQLIHEHQMAGLKPIKAEREHVPFKEISSKLSKTAEVISRPATLPKLTIHRRPQPKMAVVAVEVQPREMKAEESLSPTLHILPVELKDIVAAHVNQAPLPLSGEMPTAPENQPVASEWLVEEARQELGIVAFDMLSEFIESAPPAVDDSELRAVLLPEEMNKVLVEFVETASPAELVVAAELTQQIAVASERLQVLCASGEEKSEEALMIEEILAEWYDQLLNVLGVTQDEELVRAFVKQAGIIEAAQGRQMTEWIDEGTHEVKASFDITTLLSNMSDEIKRKLQSMRLGSFLMQSLAI